MPGPRWKKTGTGENLTSGTGWKPIFTVSPGKGKQQLDYQSFKKKVEKLIILCQNNTMIKKNRISYNIKNVSKSFFIRRVHEFKVKRDC